MAETHRRLLRKGGDSSEKFGYGRRDHNSRPKARSKMVKKLFV